MIDMEEHIKKYMVEFEVPYYFDENLDELLEQQKHLLSDYFVEGKIFSCTVSKDQTRLWMIMLADSESELLTIIDSLAIAQFCEYDYSEIMTHSAVQFIPDYSLN